MDETTVQQKPFRAANAAYDVVAFAASAGGLNALSVILSQFTADFPAAILVVQHISPNFKSMMAAIIGRHTKLNTCEAKDGDVMKPAMVYFAPPDHHLILLKGGVISLVQSDPVKFVRPSADLMFVSVASVYPGRAIAIVLTGNGSDGSTGAVAIKKSGGVVIAQDKASSEYWGMPGAAIETGSVDYVLPLDKIAAAIINLALKGIPS